MFVDTSFNPQPAEEVPHKTFWNEFIAFNIFRVVISIAYNKNELEKKLFRN